MLAKFIQRSVALSKKYNIQEYVRQANLGLIELAKDSRTTPEEFDDAVAKLAAETGYNVWQRLVQVRGSQDTVKLLQNPTQMAAANRDSFTLKLINRASQPYGNETFNSMNDPSAVEVSQSTEKWNPLTFAIYSGNLDLVRHIISKQ